MKNRTSLIRFVALVAAMMCALGASAIEAYANYTPSNTTLTFYYDNLRSTRAGTTYDLNTGTNDTGWETDGVNVNVTKVVFNSSFANARPTTTYSWFYNMKNLQSITGITYLNTSEVTNMKWMFYYCESLTSLDLSHFNTAKVTNMQSMFQYCSTLTRLDLSSFNTAKATNMAYMFNSCFSLTSLNLGSFNTSSVIYMPYMFMNCSSLITVFVGDAWSTASVQNSDLMFKNCNDIVGGKGTYFDYSHVDAAYAHIDGGPSNPGYFTDINALGPYACYTPSNTTLTFYYDNLRSTRSGTTYSLKSGDHAPSWYYDGSYANVTKVVFNSSFANARPTSTYCWFYQMANLQSVTGMAYLNTSEVTDMNEMFYCCSSLVELNLSSFNTSNVLNMDEMFAYCTSLTTVCVGDGWTASRASTEDMFYHCYSIIGELGTTYNTAYDEHVGEDAAHVDLEDYPGYFVSVNYLTVPYALLTADGKTLTFYHDGQRGTRRSTANTTYSFDWADNDEPYWWRDDAETEITRVVIDASFADVHPTSTYYWFGDMTNLTGITGMQYLNTSEVTDMSSMFSECIALTSLDVSHFDTKKVKYMRGMFNSCSELTTLNVSNFDTQKVTDMAMMFAYCENLTSLDVRNFDTKKVTDMSGMFEQCSGLTSLDLSNFNTANVTKMGEMFSSCDALTSLDLSSFNTANVTNMSWMFHTCTNLRTVYVGDGWSTAKVTQSGNMFKNCTKLVGGKGTTYNASHVDKAYAHIDGGPSNPGYFTEKVDDVRGDVNGDGNVSISDVTALIDILLSGTTAPAAADCDQNGNVSISDVTALIDYLLSGGW